jgi:probable phosphoglycerate mutase
VSLSAAGRAEAAALGARLGTCGACAVYASPQARAHETAAAIAAVHRLPVVTLAALAELDIGEWTGCDFAALAPQARWTRFNAFRGGTRAPGGELQLEAQARAVGAIERLRERHGDATVVTVSHADVLKAVLGHYLGIGVDLQRRLELAPASVSVLEVDDWDARVTCLNRTAAEPWAASR